MENELSELNDLLECNERFREHIKDFIEVFVQYYGEEQRKFIERRFNSVLYVGYIPESEFKYTINKIEVLESQKMYKDIIDKTNLDVTEEQLFGGNIGDSIYSLGYYRLHCINSYREYYKEFLLGEDGRNQKYYKNSYDGC